MKLLISICLMFCLIGCKKSSTLSECIQSKVNEFKASVTFSNASVKEYSFQGELVYVFDDGSAVVDGASSVLDKDCNYLGVLGGFTGNTKINGLDFYSNSKFKKTIWHN